MNPPRLVSLSLLAILAILALVHFPAYALAGICIGGPVALLGKFWWDCRQEAKEYNQEHDLP